MSEVNVMLRATGPLFDGRAERALIDGITDSTEHVSQVAYDTVQADMSASFRNPTGFYQSRVTVDRAGGDRFRVHDDMVIYGPWLEGVSFRNATTRFKGYSHWRRTTQTIDQRATGLFQQVFGRYVSRMR